MPGRGIVAGYTPSFWGLVVLIGVASGAAGGALMKLLGLVQRLCWGSPHPTFLASVDRASHLHRLLVLAGAGVLAAGGGLLLRRMRSFGGAEVTEAVWLEGGTISLGPSLGRGILSIGIVGMGASLGREGAPQLVGAATASELSRRAGLPRWQRRLLVACGAGAGMAAVYNVPLGGALFALEVLLGTLALPLVLPALATTLIATAVAWIALPDGFIYHLPSFSVSPSLIACAAVLGPVCGLAAVAWVHLVALMNRRRPAGRLRVVAPLIALPALGLLAFAYPQLLGNGSDTVQLTLLGLVGLGTIIPLTVLKPLATAGCLGAGAPGGLFTPTLAYGVLLGALFGHLWGGLWAGPAPGSYALLGGGAVLAASMQGPLSATVLMLELAGNQSLVVPLLLGVTTASVVARLVGAPSIYSARLGEPVSGERCRRPVGILDELEDAALGAPA